MVKCAKCGHINDDRGKYCGVCGTNLHTKGFNPENHKLDSYTRGFESAKSPKHKLDSYIGVAKAIALPKRKKKWSF